MVIMNTTNPPNMFHYQNLHIDLNTHVYNPAEDTFLLLESLQYTNNDTILEIGTGCGIIALTCAQKGAHVLATDINPYALHLTQQNIKNNQHLLQGTIILTRGNLFDMIKPHTMFDVIIFNPPYLPTTQQYHLPGWINAAYDGGTTGTAVIKTFLHHLPHHLKPTGHSFFVGSSLQNHKKLITSLKKTVLTHQIVNQQLIGDEYIYIYHVSKNRC